MFFGTADISTGGKVSFGPPDGGKMLAQPELPIELMMMIESITNTNILSAIFIFLSGKIICKLIFFPINDEKCFANIL